MTEAIVKFVSAAVITILIEIAVLYSRWKGDKTYFAAIAAVNAATNLTMNLLLALLSPHLGRLWILCLILLEIAVVLTEFFVLRIFDKKKNLFLQVLFANVLSAAIGSPILYAIGLLFSSGFFIEVF